MPDSFTPALGLIKPEVGASRDTWGAKMNTNLDVLDEFVGMAMPIGAIIDFAGPTPPPGWLVCDGRLISRTTYSQLFAVLSTYWGAGDGSTTFALPPTNGRASIGPGSITDDAGNTGSFTFGTWGGGLTRVIAQTHLPALTMTTTTIGGHAHAGSGMYGAGSHSHTTDVQGAHTHNGSLSGDHSHSGWTDAQGAHNHTVTIDAALGVGAAAGGAGVLSNVFGNATYTTSTFPAHTHAVSTYAAGNLPLYITLDGSHGHNISTIGDHAHTLAIAADGSHAHTVSLGGAGTGLPIVQPILVCTKIIYAGSQAVALDLGLDVASLRRPLLQAPMRGRH